jgi:hypothetical protein
LGPIQPDAEHFAVRFKFDGLEVDSEFHLPSLTDNPGEGLKIRTVNPSC